MKKIIFVLLLFNSLNISTGIYAQPVIQKQKTIGGSLGDAFRCMDLTTDGGLIIGGYSSSRKSLDKTDTSRGGTDYWIVKLDSIGNIQWDKTLGGKGLDELQEVHQAADGGYIVGGSSTSSISGDKTENSRGTYDYWAVKLDASGDKEWDKTFGGTGTDYLYSLKPTNDGGYILGGFSNSGISGDKTEPSRGFEDYWVIKLNGSGNKQWDKTFGGNSYEILLSIIQTSDNGYLLGGHSSSNISGDKTGNSKGGSDFWIVKLNSDGNKQWDKTFGGSLDEAFADARQTKEGGYLLGGYSSSGISGDKSQPTLGNSDFWVLKTDINGNKQWDRTFGGDNEDFLNSLSVTVDSGYVLTGASSSGISGKKTESSRGELDYWMVKINKNGKYQWDKTIGGEHNDEAYTVLERKRNDYLIGGYSVSGKTGDKTRPDAQSDYWIVEVKFANPNSTTAPISESSITLKINKKDFFAYPNPAKDILHIQYSDKAIITLSNQFGKIVITKAINGNDEISVAHLPAGLYYLKNNEKGIVQKVIITK